MTSGRALAGTLVGAALVTLLVMRMVGHAPVPHEQIAMPTNEIAISTKQLDGGQAMTTTVPAPSDVSGAEVKNQLMRTARVRSAKFTPIAPGAELATVAGMADGKGVEQDSRKFAENFFTNQASPWRPFGRRDRSFLAARAGEWVDVLLHEYQVGQWALRVYETAETLFVSFEDLILAALPEERREQVANIAREVLKLEGTRVAYVPTPYRWTLQLDGNDLTEGATFTSAPEVSVGFMQSWTERIDGGIKAGKLYFMLWKRRESGDGVFIELDERHWFDGHAWDHLQRGKYAPPKAP